MTKTSLKVLLFIATSSFLSAQAACLSTISELKANKVKTTWQETTADDGKPLKIKLAESGGKLTYTAKKDGQLWMSGNVAVCVESGKVKLTLKDTQTTDNVPGMARMMLGGDKSATVSGNQIKLGGGGWSGTFVGQ